MKTNGVKFILAIAIAVLIGFLSEIIAVEEDGRNWIAFGITALTVAAGMIPAMGLQFESTHRGVSIKVAAWLLTIVLIISNFIFASTHFKIDVYIAVNLLIATLGWVIIYSLHKAK